MEPEMLTVLITEVDQETKVEIYNDEDGAWRRVVELVKGWCVSHPGFTDGQPFPDVPPNHIEAKRAVDRFMEAAASWCSYSIIEGPYCPMA